MTETIIMHPIILWQEADEKLARVDAAILEAFDESLSSFGESVKKAVYHQFRKDYNLGEQDIPSNIEKFAATIEIVFGVGAGLVEMKILETLHARTPGFALLPDGENLVFENYVQGVRSFLRASA